MTENLQFSLAALHWAQVSLIANLVRKFGNDEYLFSSQSKNFKPKIDLSLLVGLRNYQKN